MAFGSMNADFLSGLLLVAILLVGAGYLIKEFFWEIWVDFYRAQKAARNGSRSVAQPSAINDPLVGASGRVVDAGSQGGRMRVRVGMESWHARTVEGTEELVVGTEVRVKAVDGHVLEVVPKAVAAPSEAGAPS